MNARHRKGDRRRGPAFPAAITDPSPDPRPSRRARAAFAPILLLASVAGAGACGAQDGMPGAAAPAAPSQGAAAPAEMMPGMAPPPAEAAPAEPPSPAAQAAPAADRERGDDRDEMKKAEAEAPPLWAPVRQFPTPNYQGGYEGPRTDFRETVFWQPSVKTGEQGTARVEFYLSDAVTSFRATVEGIGRGGTAGRGDAALASKLPVSLASKLPLEVSTGDVIRLPVTLTNTTWRTQRAAISAQFGPAFERADQDSPGAIELKPQESRSFYYGLKVTGQGIRAEEGKITLSAETGRLKDAMSRVVKVVPAGFPREQALSGTLGGVTKQDVELPDTLPGTLLASLALYPSPTATLVAGTDAIIQEPGGCFEQASSANYPNVMVLGYLKEQGAAAPELVARTEGALDRGYKLLTGYESKSKGYEWFGGDPGHEALTAYGLMEFSDMAKVYADVDKSMITRTADWLKSRRDGKGGYQKNERALDSFGRASDEVTNAYVTYALTEAGQRELPEEIAYLKKLSGTTKDPYVLALAAGALANVDPRGAETGKAQGRLAKLQAADGHYPGADHSITRSGGIALEIETTALATLALMKTPEEHPLEIQKGLDWMVKQRGGSGGFGSTQSTVLALKALTRAASQSRTPPEGTITLTINGGAPHAIKVDASMKDKITLAGLATELRTGHNTIELTTSSPDLKMPYGMKVAYRTLRPASSGKSPVTLAVSAPSKAKLGEGVKVHAIVANASAKGIPMVIARVGIPGGLAFQTWQLDELKSKGVVDFYETREREVIVYFRSMGPKAQKAFDLDLLAQIPGTFQGPASQAYLYYTDELRTFADPIPFTVTP
jgi:alpha-2-macroglobulin-like protein